MNPTTPYEPSGSWDSIHVFETVERGRQAHYKLSSTIMLHLITRKGSENDNKSILTSVDKKATESWKRDGEVSLSGSMTRQVGKAAFQAQTVFINSLQRRSRIGPYMTIHLISLILGR
jgi:hypothetical protein